MPLSKSGMVAAIVMTALASGCSLVVDFAGFVGTDASSPSDASSTIDGSNTTSTNDAGDASDTVVLTDASPQNMQDAPSSGPCTIAAVQAVPGTATEHVMTATSTDHKTITETAGNLLVAVAYGGQGPGNTTPLTSVPNMTFTVTDTLGNTFYAGPMIENSNSHQAAIQIFYAMNILGGTNTVTVVSAGAMVPSGDLSTGLFLQEYSGLATTDVVDLASGQMAPSSTATVQPGSITTRTSCDLVVGAFTDGHVSEEPLTAGSGWMLRSTDVWDPGGAVDNVQSNGVPQNTAVNATINLTNGDDNGWVASQIAFRAATTSPLPQPARVAFTTTPKPLVTACSMPVTIASLNGGTIANVATSSTGIPMTITGPAMTFYIDAQCVYPITTLWISAGTSSGTFYFKGTPGLITVTPTGFPAISQDQSATSP